jgi:hypothetical protein
VAGIESFEKVLWAITVLLKVGLGAVLIYHKNYRTFPLFFAYVLMVIAQSVILFVSYRIWGFDSREAFVIGWGTQGLAIVARALAVAELCMHVLAGYRGIWGLAWRLLMVSAVLVLLCSLAAAGFDWPFIVLNADRGLELAIAVLVVVLFLFVRYYEVAMEPVLWFGAIGFFLYSCFGVLNDTILERWSHGYAALWNLTGTLAYLASLLLWGWAFRGAQTQNLAIRQPALHSSSSFYRALTPEINAQLEDLNENLKRLWD